VFVILQISIKKKTAMYIHIKEYWRQTSCKSSSPRERTRNWSEKDIIKIFCDRNETNYISN